MKIAVSQSNYLPWVGYFKLISGVDKFIFYDQVQYTKNDWRNRNRIIVDGRIEWLSIPVKYKFSDRKPIERIRLPESNWQTAHLSRIRKGYKSTSYFEDYFGPLESILVQGHSLLSELNQNLLFALCKSLEIRTSLISSFPFNFNLSPSERLIDVCIANRAQEYVTTPKARNYLNLKLFEKHGIDVTFMNFDSCIKVYNQGLIEFDPHVSIIDLLFRRGVGEARERLLIQ